jgi:hypothetical protein
MTFLWGKTWSIQNTQIERSSNSSVKEGDSEDSHDNDYDNQQSLVNYRTRRQIVRRNPRLQPARAAARTAARLPPR